MAGELPQRLTILTKKLKKFARLNNHLHQCLSMATKLYHASRESLLLQVVVNQPIVVCIEANQDFHMYGSGIYDGSCNPCLNHAMIVIGYGRSEEDGG